MAPTYSSISFLQSVVATTLAVFSLTSNAQLVGCDTTGCPLNQYNQPSCVIGNVTSSEIGVANITTAITPEPLTWTLAGSESTDPTNASQTVFGRDLYLGTPPSLDLPASTTVQGCALFFEGITSSLANTDVGTCSDILGSSCVNDLVALANQDLGRRMAGTNDSLLVCQQLGEFLSVTAPQSCSSARGESWGTITAKALTGSTSSGPSELGNCHPTTGKNYTISLVDSYSITGPDNALFMGNFVSGVTPIMSIFFPTGPITIDGIFVANSLGTPELHLTCMKTVGSQDGCVGCGSSTGTLGVSSIIRPTMQLAIMAAMVMAALISI